MRNLPLVQACFDESGKLNDSEVVAFGGCVARENTWIAFSPEWQKRLNQDGLEFTSMKDAIHYKGAFFDWKEEKRDALLYDLAVILSDSPILRIVSPMTTADFKALPRQQREKFGNNLQYCGFEACVKAILHEGSELGVGFPFHIICDSTAEYDAKCLKLFHKLRNDNPAFKDRCIAITFADDQFNAGLQAADMVAYCARAEALQTVSKPLPVITRIISLFRSQRSTPGSLLYRADGPGLGHGQIES